MDSQPESQYFSREKLNNSVDINKVYHVWRNLEVLILNQSKFNDREFSKETAKNILLKEEADRLPTKKINSGKPDISISMQEFIEPFDLSDKILNASVDLANKYGKEIRDIFLSTLYLREFRKLLFNLKDKGESLGIDPLGNIMADFEGFAFEVKIGSSKSGAFDKSYKEEELLRKVVDKGQDGWRRFINVLYKIKPHLEEVAKS